MIAVIISFLACLAFAESEKLSWDRHEGADYYRVYWSTDPDDFSDENSLEVDGDTFSIDLSDSQQGMMYYFSVKAFNSCGNSSEFSDVVASAHIPARQQSVSTRTDHATSADGSERGCFIGQVI
jgi:hypothetical protein